MPSIALFPLNTVLFPGATLPLHIFEPRYRRMLADCLAGDKSFGINGGIGVQFTKLFMEARWHRINGDNNTTSTIMPLTVGFMF